MRYTRSQVSMALASFFLVAAWGCSDTPPVATTNAEAKVSGTITVRGKPMTGGEITFDPSNIERTDAALRKATIGKDGTYSLTTLQGHNSARISGSPMLKKEPQLAYGIHTIDVKPGDNTFNIELPPKE